MILRMARRMLAWLLVTPLAAVGVLAAHAAAYAVTGTSLGEEHGYLEHAPQVAGLLASLALVGLALQDRSLRPRSAWWVAPIAPLGFTCQEHIERLVHTGQLPFLLTSPTFLLGLALQLPVAAVCVVLVRRIVGTLPGARRRSLVGPGGAWLPLTDAPLLVVRSVWRTPPRGRGPPALRGA